MFSGTTSQTIIRCGTVGGFTALKAACKEHGCTIGGFIFAVVQFFTAAVHSIFKFEGCGGEERAQTDENMIAHLTGTYQGSLNYDINWRDRVDPPVGNRLGMMVGYDFVPATIHRSKTSQEGDIAS